MSKNLYDEARRKGILSFLKFNGKAAKCNLCIESVQVSLEQETLNVAVYASDHFNGKSLFKVAYDVDGLCGRVLCESVFPDFRVDPIVTAEDREISKYL